MIQCSPELKTTCNREHKISSRAKLVLLDYEPQISKTRVLSCDPNTIESNNVFQMKSIVYLEITYLGGELLTRSLQY